MDHTGKDTSYLPEQRPMFFHLDLFVTEAVSSNRWIRELHLHSGDRSTGDGGGPAGQSGGQLSRLRPVCVFLVPHVRLAHRHSAYQTAQTDSRRSGRHSAVDCEWSSRQSLEGRPCPCAPHQQTLSGNSVRLLVCDVFGHWV